MASDPPALSTAVSLDYKMNLGNYESASVFLSLSGITSETTPEEMEEMLSQQKIAFNLLRKQMQKRAATVRADDY